MGGIIIIHARNNLNKPRAIFYNSNCSQSLLDGFVVVEMEAEAKAIASCENGKAVLGIDKSHQSN